jgi:acetoin utilization protein AcuC
MDGTAHNSVTPRNVLIYSDGLASFDFGPAHPFKPGRAKQMVDLLSRYSLIYESNQAVEAPGPAGEDVICLVHDRKYIELLKSIGRENADFSMAMLEAGLGTEDNPAIPGIYDFCSTVTGGTVHGARLLDEGGARMVFNPQGGFHHAGADHAEGFCYINDLAVAIEYLTRRGRRIAYIDIDVHFGNGVRDIFALRDDVMCISIHESGLSIYPWSGFVEDIGEGRGRGYTANIPLLQGSDDEVFLHAFEAVVPPLIGAFGPDIVVAVIGADTHREDLLGHLNLTSMGYERTIRIIDRISPKLLVTGGGGYNVYKTAALWTLAWANLCGLEPVDAYAGLIGGMMYGPEAQSGTLRDNPYVVSGNLKEQCMEYARDMVAYLKSNLFPLHGLT